MKSTRCRRCRRRSTSPRAEGTFFRKEGNDSGFFSAATPSPAKTGSYVNSLSGKGRPLPAEANQFFSARMGYDFSNVKVHADKDAAESAKEINAKAYTKGNNIVFNEGQYDMESVEGKRLMAHELTHVIQQNGAGSEEQVNRQITYPAPSFNPTSAVNKMLAGVRLAQTFPTVNGVVLPDSVDDARDIILTAMNLKGGGASMKTKDNATICSYTELDVDISANIALINQPNRGKWTGSAVGDNFSRNAAVCKGVGTIPVEATGDPDSTTIYDKVKANEMEHYNDLKALSNQYLVPLQTMLRSFRGATAANDADCVKELNTYLNGREVTAVNNFLTALNAKVAARDVNPGPHQFINGMHFNADCSKLTISVHQ